MARRFHLATTQEFYRFKGGYTIDDCDIVKDQEEQGKKSRVYLAQTPHGELRAIKILACRDKDEVAELKTLFKNEVKVLESVKDNSGLSKIEYSGVHNTPKSNGYFHYMRCEYEYGQKLDSVKLKPQEIIDIIYQTALTLQQVAQTGYIHGDIHPARLLQRFDGRVILTGGMMKPGFKPSIYTPFYRAPEHIRKHGHIDQQTDIYQLGKTIAGLFRKKQKKGSDTLRLRVKRYKPGISDRHCGTRPFLQEIDFIAEKMTEESKEERYKSMDGVLRDLEALYDESKNSRRLIDLELEELIELALNPFLSNDGFSYLINQKYPVILGPRGLFDKVSDPERYSDQVLVDSYRPPEPGQKKIIVGTHKECDIVLFHKFAVKHFKDKIAEKHMVIKQEKMGFTIQNIDPSLLTEICTEYIGSETPDEDIPFKQLESKQFLPDGSLIRLGGSDWIFEVHDPEGVRRVIKYNYSPVTDSSDSYKKPVIV